MKVSLLILAYNEEKTIINLLEEHENNFDNITVINDCSTDNTKNLLLEAEKKMTNLSLINNIKNYGAGKSFEIGVKEFLASESEFLLKIDGDNQFEYIDILKLKETVTNEDLDFIKCDRFWANGIVGKIPSIRYFGNSFASFLIKIATGNWRISDPLNGLFIISRKSLENFTLPKLFYKYGYPFYVSSYISNLSIISDIKIGQYKNVITYRNEQSKLSATKMFFKLIFFVVSNFLKKIKLKFQVSELQISGILDTFSIFLFTLMIFSLSKFISIRYFGLGGPQGTWFIVLLIFSILFTVIFIYSQKIESVVSKSKFREID